MMMTTLSDVAKMERDLLVERTQAGVARAKLEGKELGRPKKLRGTAPRDHFETPSRRQNQ
jgi:DNA invertase Pin-like site-specific DNA recombinase